MNAYQKLVNAKNILVMTTALFAVQAQAALPDTAKQALEGAKTDGLEAGWIVVGVVAALFVIKIVKGLIR